MLKTSILACAAGLLATPAFAGVCEGTVFGLSSHYDPATGSGFLAVRAGPHASAQQVGELYNGAPVEIDDHQGNWYLIVSEKHEQLSGWASAKWIHTDCQW